MEIEFSKVGHRSLSCSRSRQVSGQDAAEEPPKASTVAGMTRLSTAGSHALRRHSRVIYIILNHPERYGIYTGTFPSPGGI